MSRSLEGLSNKINVQQAASSRNQEVTNQLARKALALPDDAPLNEATLIAFRDKVAEPYRQISAISKQAAAKLEQLKQTRFEANSYHKFYGRSADPSALKQARFLDGKVNDLERSIERFAVKAGKPDLVDELRGARKLIAKSYTIENAIKEGTGNVDAAKVAQALNKGAPLSEEMLTIAKFHNKFPKAAQTPEKTGSVPMFTLTDVALGAAGGIVNPALAGAALMRPAARNIALSSPVQNALSSPSYGPSATTRLTATWANNPRLRALLPGLGAGSVLDLEQ